MKYEIREFDGRTYGEMEPREILESQIQNCLEGIETELEFSSLLKSSFKGKAVKELTYRIDGQYQMLKRWQYILHCFDKGDK